MNSSFFPVILSGFAPVASYWCRLVQIPFAKVPSAKGAFPFESAQPIKILPLLSTENTSNDLAIFPAARIFLVLLFPDGLPLTPISLTGLSDNVIISISTVPLLPSASVHDLVSVFIVLGLSFVAD